MKKTNLSLCLLILLPALAAGEESAQFLKLGVGARAIGMGGAYAAIADDISAMSWNPAGLSLLRKREIGAMDAELAADTRYDFLGYAQPTKYGTLGVGAVHLSHGSIGGRDAAGRLTGSFTSADTAVNFSFARSLSASLGFGGNVKYLRSSIADASSQSVAFDLGGIYSLGRRGPGIVSLGFSAQNLGPGLAFFGRAVPLPLTLTAAAGYRLPAGMTLAVDFRNRPYAGSSEITAGTEYAVISSFAIRAGYASNHGPISGSTQVSDLTGFAAGFGLKAFGYNFDYSMTPFGSLGNAQRFSLGARF